MQSQNPAPSGMAYGTTWPSHLAASTGVMELELPVTKYETLDFDSF